MSYSNNKFPNCPALMEDGKIFTDYRAHKLADLEISKKHNINDSQSYRMFLQENGKKLIIDNKKDLEVYVCKTPNKNYDPLNKKNFKGYDKGGNKNYAKF